MNEQADPIRTAKEAAKIAMYSAHQVGTALIAAEQRIGELLLAIPKATTNHKNQNLENADDGKFLKGKTETAREMGYSHADVRDYQQMAKNPEVVQRVMDEAINSNHRHGQHGNRLRQSESKGV